jgi:hypothetical protein
METALGPLAILPGSVSGSPDTGHQHDLTFGSLALVPGDAAGPPTRSGWERRHLRNRQLANLAPRGASAGRDAMSRCKSSQTQLAKVVWPDAVWLAKEAEMARRLQSHIAGNLVGYVALFVSLSGVAYAAERLPPGSVGSRQLTRSAVTRSKLAAGAVTGTKVAANSLTGRQIDASTLGTVPTATTAVTATTATYAGTAGTAGTATAATHAGTADTATRLGSVTLVRTDGAALAPKHAETIAAFCSGGRQPIGGGGRADAFNDGGTLVSSRPTVSGSVTAPGTGASLEGWLVGVVNNSATDIHPSAWVICAG